jgi:hypothetical protein
MSKLIQAIKTLGLTEFYFSLSVSDKAELAKYSKYLVFPYDIKFHCSTECDECFVISNAAQFLWATAANAIPHRKYSFAERLLSHALDIAVEADDLAWIHANLAQVYYDKHKIDSKACLKAIHHCHELIRLGFMKSWAENMMEELVVFQI